MRVRLKLPLFLGLVFLFLFGLVFPLIKNAHSNQAYEKVAVPYSDKGFIAQIGPVVKPYADTYGIRPSVIIGQILLESQSGQTLLASRYHNLFAMQAQPGQASVQLISSRPAVQNPEKSLLRFSRYKDWEASIADYFVTLRKGQVWDKQLYRQLASQEVYKAPAQALEDYIYAYDKDYSNKLIKVIEDNNLTRFD